MLQDYAKVYYGPGDLMTGHYIKKLIDDSNETKFMDFLIETARKDIQSLEDYEEILKIRVIFEYKSVMGNINRQEFLEMLNCFYRKLDEEGINQELVKTKVLRYINKSTAEIFKEANFEIQNETLKICLQFPGSKALWSAIVNNASESLQLNHFYELYGFLKKNKLNDVSSEMINTILFPFSMNRYDDKLGVALQIRDHFKDIFVRYKNDLSKFFESVEFSNLPNINQVAMLRNTLGTRILGVEGEIQLKIKLETAEKVFNDNLKRTGMKIEATSERFSKLEIQYKDFREKIYLLTYEEGISRYQLMQYQDQKQTSILNILSNLDGVQHEKYGNVGFKIMFDYCDMQVIVDTMYFISKYKEELWEELLKLVNDVEKTTEIGGFLKKDIKRLKKLFQEEDYFLSSSFLTQLIERLLREILFKLLYGVTYILKEPKITLGNMLRKESELNEVFTSEEIETLEYYLVNSEYGLNLRNNLAHYNIDSEKVDIHFFIRLLHILLFILIKIDYQGTMLEKQSL